MITRTDTFGSNAVLNRRVAFDQADGQSAKPAEFEVGPSVWTAIGADYGVSGWA